MPKKTHSSATSASLMMRIVQLLRHDAYNCTIISAWRVQLYNYGRNQACWWPIRFENFDIVMIIIIIIIEMLAQIQPVGKPNLNSVDAKSVALITLSGCLFKVNICLSPFDSMMDILLGTDLALLYLFQGLVFLLFFYCHRWLVFFEIMLNQ